MILLYAYALSSAGISSPPGNYVTILRTRHSGRGRLSGRDPESSKSDELRHSLLREEGTCNCPAELNTQAFFAIRISNLH